MIRRAAWLAAGAVGGIYGYRRLGRLARSLVPWQESGGRGPRGVQLSRRRARLEWPGRGLTRLAAAGGFWRDVRDGMAEYLDQHSPPGNTLLPRGNGRAHPPGSDNPKDGR